MTVAIEMNRCLKRTVIPEWMTTGKTILIQDKKYQKTKDPKRNRYQQLQTHNVPTDDVKNINGTN